MIYVINFTLSAMLLDISKRLKSKFLSCFIFMISVLLPVYLATNRSIDVGIDVRVYILPHYSLASSFDSLLNYLLFSFANHLEPGYAVINYLGSRMTGDLRGVFFLIEMLVVLPVYYKIYKDKNISPLLPAFVFLCIFYNLSLNIARQAIALSIILFAYDYLRNNKKGIFLGYLILAIMFHYSAIIALSFLVIETNEQNRLARNFIIFSFIFIFIVFYEPIIRFTVPLVFKTGAEKYLGAFLKDGTGYVSIWQIFYNLLYLSMILICKTNLKKTGEFNFFLTMAIAQFFLYFLNLYNGNCFRYVLYFMIFTPVVAGRVMQLFKMNYKFYVGLSLYFVFLYYWFVVNYITDAYGTMPYASF